MIAKLICNPLAGIQFIQFLFYKFTLYQTEVNNTRVLSF